MSLPRTAMPVLALIPCLGLFGCVTQDDARVQQLLNQRGFGARYVGDTNEQYYLGVGDQFSVTDEQHPEFDNVYAVRPDGVIDVANVGEVFVAGLTIPDVEETLKRRYREFNTTADPHASLIASTSKWFFIDGEVRAAGRKPFDGDITLFKAVFDAAPTLLADNDSVELIRSDPYHPLVVEFDYDDMLKGGWSKNNVEVRENDIIFVPPNLFGYLTEFTARLFSPLQVIVLSVFSANRLIFAAETFGDTSRFVGFGRNRFGGNGYVPLDGDADGLAARLAPLAPELAPAGGR